MNLRAIIKKIIYIPSDVIKFVYFGVKGVKYPANSRIRGKIHLVPGGKIEIGENCKLNGANKFNPIGFCGVCNFVAEKGAVIKIGKNFGASGVTLYSRNSITIGDNVMLGGGVKVYDTDFHSLDWNFRGTIQDKANTISKPVVIDDNAFIGAGTIVLKGVHIGNCSIVGAGSVVTKNIPAGQIWAGNPAKFIKNVDL